MSDYHSATGFIAPAPEALAPFFPEYQITNLVACGGMGAVYRAVQTSLDREVAIKILPVEFGSDAEYSAAFEAEAKAMGRLNHPNLIGVYDFGEVQGMLFIVMEFVAGQSLHDACHGMAVEPQEAIRLVMGVAQGLAHAHDHGILHRDIKPANILLDGRLQPKIGDFGLARPVDRKVQEGEAIFGTPGYTAPEVLAPPHQVDQRADIFSLGVLMHELLTGKLPLDDPRPPSLICQCDPRLDKVVRKASHNNPNVRYQHASDIVAELEKISGSSAPRLLQTQEVPIPAAVMGNTASYAMPTKKGNGGLIAIMVVLGLLLGGGYYFSDLLIGTSSPVIPVHEEGDFDEAEHESDDGAVVDPATMDYEDDWNGEDVLDTRTDTVPVEPLVQDPDSAPVSGDDVPVIQPEDVPWEPAVVERPPVVREDPPAPVRETSIPPKFDVDGLLVRAREVMRQRCIDEMEKHRDLYDQNNEAFRRSLQRGAKENLDQKWWRAADQNIAEEMQRIEDNKGRIPDALDGQLKYKPWAKELHAEYFRKQEAIDLVTNDVYVQQSKTYIRGLEMRLPKLREDNDPGAVDLIQKEIDRVLLNAEYFRQLMIGR